MAKSSTWSPKLKLPRGHVSLTKEDFNRPTKIPTKGDKRRVDVYCAFGQCVSQFSFLESSLGCLFQILLGASTGGAANAFGTIIGIHTRLEALRAAALDLLPRYGRWDLFDELMTRSEVIKQAAARRNEVAHGIVCKMEGKGWFLVPPSDHPRWIQSPDRKHQRLVDLENNPVGWHYKYTTTDLKQFANRFGLLHIETYNFSIELRAELWTRCSKCHSPIPNLAHLVRP